MTAIRMQQIWLCAALAWGIGTARADPPAYQYEALAYVGTHAPTGGSFQGSFQPGALGTEGEVAYVAGIGSPGAQALFLDTADGLLTVAAPGMAAADGWSFAVQPGVIGGISSPVSMSPAGDIVFAADLERGAQTGAGTFLWKRAQQTLAALSLPGQVTADGVRLGNARAGADIAGNGDIVFAADLPELGGLSETGIVRLSQGQATIIVRPGEREPGGGQFLRAGRPRVNSEGRIAFQADVIQDGHTSTGVFLWSSAGLVVAAGLATPAPDGSLFLEVREPRLNDRSELAFFGETGEWAVYLVHNDRMARIAGRGAPLPGGDRVARVVVSDGAIALNREGVVAMVLKTEKRAEAGVFLYQNGELWPVILPGTVLATVGPIDNVGPSVALSDQGQVAFQAELADGQVALVLASPVRG